MANTDSPSNPSPAFWKASLGRIVLFVTAPAYPRASVIELYRELWDVQPENISTPENLLLPAIASGSRNALIMTCAAVPGRIEFSITPQPRDLPALPLIQDRQALYSELTSITEFARDGFDYAPVVRVAFHLQLLSPQSDIVQANRVLLSALPERYKVRLTNQEDFLLQVNEPYRSDSTGLKINCVTKWSIETFRIVGVPTGGDAQIEVTQIAPSVLFDFNSARVSDESLSSEQRYNILREALQVVGERQASMGIHDEGFH